MSLRFSLRLIILFCAAALAVAACLQAGGQMRMRAESQWLQRAEWDAGRVSEALLS